MTSKRKKIIADSLFTSAVAGMTMAQAVDGSKPNIVLVFVDDLGYSDLSCYGSPLCQTPNIDRLAREGMRFTDAYAAGTVCSPTRAALLTGQYPARTRITDWIPGHQRVWEKLALPDWRSTGIRPDDISLPALLGEVGYASVMLGKWHLGRTAPTEIGFTQGVEEWSRNRKEDPDDPKGVFSLTQEALDFMRENRDRPVFVYLSHFAVHGPLRYHPDVLEKFEALAPPDSPVRPGYAAMVHALDESVGILMQGIEDLGVADNTLVIFYSDNGGCRHQTTNHPLRGHKGTQFEGGLRVPLIAWWPGRVPAGSVSSEVVTTVDFLPTFCEVAGVSSLPPEVDGVSFRSVMTEQASLDRSSIYWHYPHYHYDGPAGVIRSGDYKLIEFFEDQRIELYNLERDIGETTDLSRRMPEKAGELLNDLRAWRASVGAQMMEPNPGYDPARVGQRRR